MPSGYSVRGRPSRRAPANPMPREQMPSRVSPFALRPESPGFTATPPAGANVFIVKGVGPSCQGTKSRPRLDGRQNQECATVRTPNQGFETTFSSSAQLSTCLAVVLLSMRVGIMPGRLARGVNHILAAGEVTGFRLTQFGTAGHPKRRRFIPQPGEICVSTCRTFILRNALSGIGVNDRVGSRPTG